MNSEDLCKLDDALEEAVYQPVAFTAGHLISWSGSASLVDQVEATLKADTRFVWLDSQVSDVCWFVSSRALLQWFVRLTMRLSETRQWRLRESQLAGLVNSLRPDGKWISTPSNLVDFGGSYGFVSRAYGEGQYVFPMARVFSFLSYLTRAMAEAELEKFIRRKMAGTDDTQALEQILEEGMREFDDRTLKVVFARSGLLTGPRVTLQQLAREFSLTRERVRQIEAKFWRRLRSNRRLLRPFIIGLLSDICRNRGSFVLTEDTPQSVLRAFVAGCVGVPVVEVPGLKGIALIGHSKDSVMEMTSIVTHLGWQDAIDHDEVVAQLESAGVLCLIREDMSMVANLLANIRRQRLTKEQRVYLALKAVGRPAHYSKVTDIYCSMFPEHMSMEHTERNVHAVLNREKLGVVWIGVRGTFALREWGFERPPNTLFETIAQIVKVKYDETGKPVSKNVVRAEIGKYRSLVKETSFQIAITLNEHVIEVSKGYFVPACMVSKPMGDDLNERDLDTRLQDFERRVRDS